LKQVNSLEDKLEKILIDILANEGIHSHISNKMEVEINKMLRDESIIKMMIEILKGTQ